MGDANIMNKTEIRCIHRHTIESHPNCFKRGLIKRSDWWHDKRIGYLDIEASNLDANWGFMLSWCIKPRGEKAIYEDVVSQKDLIDFTFDKRITESLVEAMKQFDILVTYYGTGFDIPFIRTRALFNKTSFPEFGSIYHWDLYYKVRGKFKLHRNSLEVVTRFFGIEGKTHLSPEMMMKARYGDSKALKWLLHHNREDVIITEELHNLLWEHSKWIKKSI
jgi:uncharacterized protein YprB with RNaseH-like and TPR domain